MIPLGIALSGWVVGVGEPIVGRAEALKLPLWLAGGLMLAVSLVVAVPLRRGIARATYRE